MLIRLRLLSVVIAMFCMPAAGQWFQDEQAIMGTRVVVELQAQSEDLGQRALLAVMAEMRRIDKAYNPDRSGSELSELNRLASKQRLQVSAELFDLLTQARQISVLSDGAFDISFASIGRLYDYRAGKKPTPQALQRLKSVIDYRQISLFAENRSVRFLHPDIYVDLGGIAKGYAVDRAIAVLQKLGVVNAVVSAGGDSRTIGDKNGRPWTVGIQHPRKPDEMAVVLPLQDSAFSTSGDYERYFVEDGVRYHHILDPATGESARHVQSVTILADDATSSDALSTTVFVLGFEKGLALIERLPGIDAILIDHRGQLHYSDGLKREK